MYVAFFAECDERSEDECDKYERIGYTSFGSDIKKKIVGIDRVAIAGTGFDGERIIAEADAEKRMFDNSIGCGSPHLDASLVGAFFGIEA